jgi:hypothetical protein
VDETVILAAALGVFGIVLWVLEHKSEKERIRGLMSRVNRAVLAAAAAHRITVGAFKEANGDRELTTEEMMQLKRAVLDVLKARLGTNDLIELSVTMDLVPGEARDHLLSTSIEEAVQMQERS